MEPADAAADLDTFPKLLARNARDFKALPAYREKEYGIWQSWTWAETEAEVLALAAGFEALGLGAGDHLAIIGRNRPHLYWAMVAAQACGAVPVPLYQDAVAEEMAHVLEHCGARFVVAGDQEQVDKVLEVSGPPAAAGRGRLSRSQGPEKLRSFPAAPAERRRRGGARRGGGGRGAGAGAHRRAGGGGHLRDALHLGHHRAAEGGGALEPQHHRHGAGERGLRPAGAAGQRAGLSADGLGGGLHLLHGAGLGLRLLRRLPGEPGHHAAGPARDRAELLLRAAAVLRGDADRA